MTAPGTLEEFLEALQKLNAVGLDDIAALMKKLEVERQRLAEEVESNRRRIRELQQQRTRTTTTSPSPYVSPYTWWTGGGGTVSTTGLGGSATDDKTWNDTSSALIKASMELYMKEQQLKMERELKKVIDEEHSDE